jgi:hypothetical protein
MAGTLAVKDLEVHIFPRDTSAQPNNPKDWIASENAT